MNRSRALQRISVSSLRLSAVGLLAATPLGAIELRSGASPRPPLLLTLDTFAREGDAWGNTSGPQPVLSQGSDSIETAPADPARVPLLLARGLELENRMQEPFDLAFGWEVAQPLPGQPNSTPRDRSGAGGGSGNANVPIITEADLAAAVAAAAREPGTLAIAHPAVRNWTVDRSDAKAPLAFAAVAGASSFLLLPSESTLPESNAPSRPSEVPTGDGRIFFPGSSLWNSGNANGTIAKPAFSLNALVSLTLSLPVGEFVSWTGVRGELGGNEQASSLTNVGTTLGKAGRSTPGAVADVISPIGYSFNDIALGQPTGRRTAADLLGQASRFDSGTALGGQIGEGRLEVRAIGSGASSSSIPTARFESGGSLGGGDGGRLEAGQAVFGRTDRGNVQASSGSSGRQPTSVTVDAPQRPPSFLVGHLLPRPAVRRNDGDVVRPSTSPGSFTIDRNQQHETVLGVAPGGAEESEVNPLTLDGGPNAPYSDSLLPPGNAFRFHLGGGAMVGPGLAPAAGSEVGVFGLPSNDVTGSAQILVMSSPVPEPTTWLLLAVSLGVISAARRFRRA